jgi:pimeloyl-ACP methyl ester carboxylesterase
MDSLKIEKADFIGASAGGFAALNIALYAPERVKSLVLGGPMGYAGTNLSILQIVITTMFPIPPLQANTFDWAFGDDPKVREA